LEPLTALRIIAFKLTKTDSGVGHQPLHHHFIDMSLVADIEGNKVRLSANGNVAVTMETH
jgi:hypothetical protein